MHAVGIEAGGEARANDVPAEQVRAALESILASPEFRTSPRCQDFLRFVVETTLAGAGSQLKERTVAVEVFGRPASYDPGTDSSVRVRAGEVRKRLIAYYAGSGAASVVQIELPGGTYRPVFRRNGHVPSEVPAPPFARTRRWRPWAIGGTVVLALVVLAPFVLRLRRPTSSRIDPVLREFWGPALASPNPVLFCLSYVPVYGLDPNLEERGAKPRAGSDFTLLPDRFLGGGDVNATGALVHLFTSFGHDYRIKIGSDVSLRDLRSSPAVLVGYSYTNWVNLFGNLRYRLDSNPAAPCITDSGKPTRWVLPPRSRDRRADEDYALVCRLFQPDTETTIVLVAGITQYGTESAVDMVTTPALLSEAARKLPAGWSRHNVELVLHTRVISDEVAAPRVVASHVW